MQIVSQILFVAALGLAAYFISRRVMLIKNTIQLGRAEDRSDNPSERLKTMLLIAFGQKKDVYTSFGWFYALHYLCGFYYYQYRGSRNND